MSQTVTMIGKMKEIKPIEGQSLNDYALNILKERGKKIEDYYDSPLEQLQDDFYKEFVLVNNKLYQIIENKENEGGAIFLATSNPDESISYTLQYYNGGCGFSEALEYALKNLK